MLADDFDKLRIEKNEEFIVLTPTDADESFADLKVYLCVVSACLIKMTLH